jgi:hypothetical protein
MLPLSWFKRKNLFGIDEYPYLHKNYCVQYAVGFNQQSGRHINEQT